MSRPPFPVRGAQGSAQDKGYKHNEDSKWKATLNEALQPFASLDGGDEQHHVLPLPHRGLGGGKRKQKKEPGVWG